MKKGGSKIIQFILLLPFYVVKCADREAERFERAKSSQMYYYKPYPVVGVY